MITVCMVIGLALVWVNIIGIVWDEIADRRRERHDRRFYG